MMTMQFVSRGERDEGKGRVREREKESKALGGLGFLGLKVYKGRSLKGTTAGTPWS